MIAPYPFCRRQKDGALRGFGALRRQSFFAPLKWPSSSPQNRPVHIRIPNMDAPSIFGILIPMVVTFCIERGRQFLLSIGRCVHSLQKWQHKNSVIFRQFMSEICLPFYLCFTFQAWLPMTFCDGIAVRPAQKLWPAQSQNKNQLQWNVAPLKTDISKN